MADLWQALYDARADVVLSGHSHDYERFAKQNNAATGETERGLRQFVVGTGGSFFTRCTADAACLQPPAPEQLVRCAQADAASQQLRLAVPSHRRPQLHRLGYRVLPLSRVPQGPATRVEAGRSAGCRWRRYDTHRARGKPSPGALRALGNRLVGILHGCLAHRVTYQEQARPGQR